MLENIQAAAAKRIPINEGDYMVDGILFCKNCHTPKQCKVDVLGQERTFMCLCKCEKERIEKEEAEKKKRERIRQIKRTAFPQSNMFNFTFDKDDSPDSMPSKVARNYCKHFEEMYQKGKGLIFYGTVGTGKSFLAACIANELINQGYSCIYTTFTEISERRFAAMDKEQELRRINNTMLLIIDDLGSERDTEYMQETAFRVIDARCTAKKPMIITTNLTAEEIRHSADIGRERLLSRIREMCFPFEVKGADRRNQILKQDYDSTIGLLTE